MRITKVRYSEYVPSTDIQWGSTTVPECSRDRIRSMYNAQGIFAWEDGAITEGRQIVKMVDFRCTGYNTWVGGMYIGEVQRVGSKWQAYDKTGAKAGVFATKSAAAERMYDISRAAAQEVA